MWGNLLHEKFNKSSNTLRNGHDVCNGNQFEPMEVAELKMMG